MSKQKMTTVDFFEALAAREDFTFAVAYTHSFKKNVMLCYKQNLDLNALYQVIVSLAKQEVLPPKNHVHPLRGYGKERKGEKYMECHITPDWLLVWVQKDDEMILVLTSTGSHALLFGM